jgi:hypothetical protein
MGSYIFCGQMPPFVRVVAHVWKSPRWTTARKVKLLLPPRQSRGISLVISFNLN